jgi:hypothetical protein
MRRKGFGIDAALLHDDLPGGLIAALSGVRQGSAQPIVSGRLEEFFYSEAVGFPSGACP